MRQRKARQRCAQQRNAAPGAVNVESAIEILTFLTGPPDPSVLRARGRAGKGTSKGQPFECEARERCGVSVKRAVAFLIARAREIRATREIRACTFTSFFRNHRKRLQKQCCLGTVYKKRACAFARGAVCTQTGSKASRPTRERARPRSKREKKMMMMCVCVCVLRVCVRVCPGTRGAGAQRRRCCAAGGRKGQGNKH